MMHMHGRQLSFNTMSVIFLSCNFSRPDQAASERTCSTDRGKKPHTFFFVCGPRRAAAAINAWLMRQLNAPDWRHIRSPFIRRTASSWAIEWRSARGAHGELALTSANVICSLIEPRCKIEAHGASLVQATLHMCVSVSTRLSCLGLGKSEKFIFW